MPVNQDACIRYVIAADGIIQLKMVAAGIHCFPGQRITIGVSAAARHRSELVSRSVCGVDKVIIHRVCNPGRAAVRFVLAVNDRTCGDSEAHAIARVGKKGGIIAGTGGPGAVKGVAQNMPLLGS